jgi:hypothetical protein
MDRSMTRSASKLLLLLAVLLMPFGMAPAAAAAQHHPMATAMGHCPDQQSRHEMKGGIAECTMACAGALPAAELAAEQAIPAASPRAAIPPAARLRGLNPDTATPPPKGS